MQVNLHSVEGNQITRYSSNSVTINQTEYTSNLLVTPNLIKNIDINSIEEFNQQFLDQLLEYKPDIIIFGTGTQIKYPDLNLLAQLQRQQIGFEVMPIPALCRTFNYLIGEGRNVLGLLIF